MRNFLIYLLLMCLVGCRSKEDLLTSYEIKKPAIENENSVKKYLQDRNVKTDNLIVFKDLSSIATASKAKMFSVPNVMFFNSKGEFVDYKKKAEDCNAKIDDFIMDLENLNNSTSIKERNIEGLLNMVSTYGHEQVSRPRGYDAYVFITWSIYAGKLNEEKAFEWMKLLETTKDSKLKVKCYLLNCDFQESWNLTDEVKKNLGLTEIR